MSTDIMRSGGALAIRPDQTDWTPEQSAVLHQSGISNDVTAAELSGFLHLCQRTQLDPFSRQIYLIGRKDKRAGRTVFTPQTGIDGYRVIAHRVVAESRENFGYEDTQWCDGAGRWRDVWLSPEPPAAAKVTVVRNGHRFPAIAVFREYVQTGWENKPVGLWGKMPAGQLAKCAEALALRKAFPHDLAGVYTAEEMGQADNPEPEARQQPEPVTPQRPARNWLVEARAAESADQVRNLYREASATGAREVLEDLAAIGREKAAEATVVEAEVVEDDERTAAVDALRGAALAAGVAATIGQDFQQSYGVPISEASVEQLAEMAQLLAGAA
ncbi:phage recombination protein Bet [Kitasatospora sp. NPDC058478]|uniref:phage recombination protein Bet n=1 Tax=unclassified Kitasatospora TaxID=2633591 RepID=UPI00366781C9